MKYPNLIPLLLSWSHEGIQVLIPSDHYRCCLEHLATERRSHAVVERGIQVENLSSNSIRCPVMPCSFRGEYFHLLSSVAALISVLIFPTLFQVSAGCEWTPGEKESTHFSKYFPIRFFRNLFCRFIVFEANQWTHGVTSPLVNCLTPPPPFLPTSPMNHQEKTKQGDSGCKFSWMTRASYRK